MAKFNHNVKLHVHPVKINEEVKMSEPPEEEEDDPRPLFTEMMSYDTTQQRWLEYARCDCTYFSIR